MQENQNLVRFELDPVSKKSLYTALKAMDKGAKSDLRDEVTSISQWMASSIISAASSAPRPLQAQAVAQSVRVRRDVMPYIIIGGSQKRTKHGTPVGTIMHGNEFGSNYYRQFP